MAIRSVATTDTLETFRTTFNDLGTDSGDLTNLNTSDKTSLVNAINEAFGATSSFTLRDSTSSTQAITGGDTLNVVGDSNISVTVSDTDILSVTLGVNVTGLTSVTASGTISGGTVTDGTASLNSGSITGLVNVTGSGTANFTTDVQVNSVSVATKPFAIAQAIALG
jgi:hypothetical protein